MLNIIRPVSTNALHPILTRRFLLTAVKYRHHLFSTRAAVSLSNISQTTFSPGFSFSFSTATSSLPQQQPLRETKRPDSAKTPKSERVYSWIDAEAESLIAKAYERHLDKNERVSEQNESYPPSLVLSDLEKIGKPQHYEPQDWVDRTAYGLMRFLRVFTHAFFREKYDHHAVTLETVAAVPGIVGAFHRHLRSLRNMQRDHSWIKHLLEESENERMHLLIFLKVTNPSRLERAIVVLAQAAYLTFYSALYLVSGRAAHRLVGYLEEEAHFAYTDYLKALDDGRLKMKPAPEIAKQYYRLPENATIRDVVLHVRADEAMHRDVNHAMANKYRAGDLDSPLVMMSKNAVEEELKMNGTLNSTRDGSANNFSERNKPTAKLSTDDEFKVMDENLERNQRSG